MYINLRSFDPNRQFNAWAYRITQNEMVNYLRKHRQTTELNEDFQYSDMFDDRPDLAEEIDKDIEAQQLHSLIDKLPMKYREVLVLHYFQNCDYESIATIINKPTSTVGTRLRRAKAQLKQLHVKEYGNAT
jgi:RNA polymerase sigma-70 factor, ECF subfamily